MPHISLSDWMQFCIDDGWPPKDLRALERIWRYRFEDGPQKFAVQYRRYTIRDGFSFWSAAYLWGMENYKGTQLGWRVVPA